MKYYQLHLYCKLSFILKVFFLSCAFTTYSQDRFTISGYLKDVTSGESLIGAAIYVKEIESGTISNVYGFYSVTLGRGIYTFDFRYLGYASQSRTIELDGNIRLDIELEENPQILETVIIKAEKEDANVTEMEMSTNKLSMNTVNKIPAFMGEVDVIKSLQLLPGVTTIGEGASGFNVRGGSVGQNLILLDEAPVYNSSHLFGFFSVFNPDAVKDVKLYKGGIPAHFGGRVSSVLDIRMKEGNNKNYNYSGGIGSIFGRFAVEGPILKERSSFILAGRRSWIDTILKPTGALGSDDAFYYYDLTMKMNYDINDKNRIFASGYFGRDVFSFLNASFSWGNSTGTLRWNHLFSNKLFTNFSLIFSEYDYALKFTGEQDDSFDWKSKIQTIDFKPKATFFYNSTGEINFGGNATYYKFIPAEAIGLNNGEVQDFSVDDRFALESALFANLEQDFTRKIRLGIGLRYSFFQYYGPGKQYILEDENPGNRKTLVETIEVGARQLIKSYSNPEPRVSLKYQVNATSSIKASYSKMAQYIHLISVTSASTPLDLWTPSTNNIPEERADLFSLGYFKNLLNNQWEFSIEAYLRKINGQLDYRNGLTQNDLLINPEVERDLLTGEARAFGLELYLKKPEGRLNGWVSYTLSRSEILTEGLNNGQWYLTNYDQPHNLKLTLIFSWTNRLSISTNFAYNTGRPYTTADQTLFTAGFPALYSSNGERNSKRIPDYHRLDISLIYDLKPKKFVSRKWESQIVLGVYNLYGRQNPFSIYPDFSGTAPQYSQFSLIAFPLPSITYNFKF